MKRNSPGCTCCGYACDYECEPGDIREVRGWNFVISGIPDEIIVFRDNFFGSEIKTVYTGYDVFNNSYTVYFDEECSPNPVIRDDVGVTCAYRRGPTGTEHECYCEDYESTECCEYPMRLVVSVSDVTLVTTYNGFDPICNGTNSPSIGNDPFVFEADLLGDYCVKKTVEVPFDYYVFDDRCENCTYKNQSGIITIERTPIFG